MGIFLDVCVCACVCVMIISARDLLPPVSSVWVCVCLYTGDSEFVFGGVSEMGGHTKAPWLPVSITVYSCDFNPISISPHLGFVSFHFFPLWLCILGPIRETQSTSDCQTHQPLFPKYHLQGVAWRSTGWHSTLSLPWAWFWSLVGELRSRQLSGRPTKEQKTKQTQNTTSRNTNIPTHTQTGFRLVPASAPCKKSIVSECLSSCPPVTELSDSCGCVSLAGGGASCPGSLP